MKKEHKFMIVFVVLMVVTFFVIKYLAPAIFLRPAMSAQTKIFNKGDIADIRKFLQRPDSNVEMDNYYALINRNQPDILEMMFKEFKLNPDNDFNYKFATPLLSAAKKFKPEIVSVLIKYGADVNYKDPYGMTPLIAASYTTFEHENPASLAITKMLVEAGADINVVADFGKRAMAGALYLNEDLDRFKYLVNNGGDINAIDKDGLNYMFYCDSIKCYEYFLSQGFEINSISTKGESVIQNAHYSEIPLSLTKQLLTWGADICHKDNAGDTVLNYVERQNTGPHDKKEKPEYYQKRLTENRASEVYRFLEQKYQESCSEKT